MNEFNNEKNARLRKPNIPAINIDLNKKYYKPANSIQLFKIFCLAIFITMPVQAANDLTEFSLEQLLTMKITSVAKKSQQLSEATAAIYVITKDDIRRSGMTSIPELLRLVPGLQVAQIDGNKWAISSRGFNGRWSNKLLVLMDGRSLYTPLFSGVYWEVQDTLLEDIERIEVIRGPGGTLWGANAVNGVINIITRHSRDTQEGLVAALLGNQEKEASLRYGSTMGGDGSFRVYAKFFNRENYIDNTGDETYDAWDSQRAGFRADWESSSRDTLTLQGDIYKGEAGQTIGVLDSIYDAAQFQQDKAELNGVNLLLNWHRSLSSDSDWGLKAYFDRNERDDVSANQRIDTMDLDFQHRFLLTEHQEIIWGLGYRYIEDNIDGSFTVSFDPVRQSQKIYSAFIQDEIGLDDDLHLTLGSKFEHNDFTGFEYQPSIRLLWQATEEDTFWGAVSRAVRTPSRADTGIRINPTAFSSPFVDPDGPGPLVAGDPTLISIFGDEGFESEELLAFDLGYRSQFNKDLSLDLALFFNRYDNLVSNERGFSVEGAPPTNALISSTFDNQLEGESYGLELLANWQASSEWRLTAGYTWLKLDMRSDDNSTDINNVADRENSSPEQQFQLRSRWDIQRDLEMDMALFYVDEIMPRDASGPRKVPAYTRLDMRLGWSPRKNLELSLVAQNILDERHAEFFTTDVTSSEVPRSIYGKVKLNF